ncbi:hypothetical protein FE782_24225 [Paenibacillus antri]|uniref:Uncharacterized protein n=1 Tax=Paenibacillus antri TaxID=2582848 RepID=A0A5R9G6R2_9BACL|nr:hypothetical protein FE782_24225 [Paenibacillus antri]
MKKTKQPGENISLKTKKTEDPLVMNWINAQTNLMDSLRYLIEHEIVRNGVRNLQTFIPVERNVLGTASPVPGGIAPDIAPATERLAPSVEAMQALRDVREGTAEIAAGRQEVRVEPESPAARIEDAEPPAAKRNVDDDIDDDDIEAWM